MAMLRRGDIVEKPKPKSNKTAYYMKVVNDVEKQFTKNKIDKSYIDINLLDWMETFWQLLQEDNIILDAIKANKIFDDLSYLYLHNQLNIDWEDYDAILENSLYEKAVLELRRPTKNFVIFWKVISGAIESIRRDENLMNEIREARNDLKATVKKFTDNPVYLTEIDNDLSKPDNIKVVDKNYKYFNIKVAVKGLYGHNYTETFKLDTPMYARDTEEAKTKFVEFMSDKFPGVKYKQDQIRVEEIK